MNFYYILAIIFAAMTTYCGIKGAEISNQAQAKKSSVEQADSAKRIEDKLNQLGSKLADVNQKTEGDVPESELKKLQKEYADIAKNFYEELPIAVQKEKAKNAEFTIDQLRRSKEIERCVRGIEKSLKAMVVGFNEAAPQRNLKIQIKDFPANIFLSMDQYRLLLSFNSKFYWLIRFVRYSSTDGPIALQIVRVTGALDASIDDNFSLTNDSINFVFFPDAQFGISLNGDISKDIRDGVFGDIPLEKKQLSEFDKAVTKIFERIIKHELVREALS